MSARVKLADNLRLSRAEVENLILLYAVGPGGCSIQVLTERLGLAPLQRTAVEAAAQDVCASRLLAVQEVGGLLVTEKGVAWLREVFPGLRWSA